jgi:Trypsin-co-occurring domain 1
MTEVPTMKSVVEYDLEAGGSVMVEVDVEDEFAEELVPAATPGEMIAKARTTFEKALGGIEPVAKAVIAKVRALEVAPDEVNVQFGLKLTGEAGYIIASASGEANFTLSLNWQMDKEG